jgi:hypothetical protein
MQKIAEVKLSSCGLEVAGFRRNCDYGITELRLRSNISLNKLRICDCGTASFKLRNCDCGLKKKLRVPTSGNYKKRNCPSMGVEMLYILSWMIISFSLDGTANPFFRTIPLRKL